MENKCSSCEKNITNDTKATAFQCPACGETKIVRCSKCRSIGAKYVCSKCGFEGP